MKSTLIKGGKIIDGTGKSHIYGDILIEGNKIVKIDKEITDANTNFIINANSLCVSPGFIDIHTHSDLELLRNPQAKVKLLQGVTTEIVGNCGFSIYPYDEKSEDEIKEYVKPLLGSINNKYKCDSVKKYFDSLEKVKPSINVGALIGHGSIRAMVKGFNKNRANSEEMNRMKDILRTAMEEGALGMSVGLAYAPGSFSDFDELKELCKVLASYDRKYIAHLRNQGKKIIDSIKENIQLSKETNVNTHISHLKVIGRKESGKINNVLKLLENTLKEGIKVTSDAYPYTAGSSMITRILPNWILEGGLNSLIEKCKQKNTISRLNNNFVEGIPGWENQIELKGWENITITSVKSNQNKFVEGLNIVEISKILNLSPVEVVCKLIIEEKGEVITISKAIYENDLQTVLKNPLTMIGSDGIYTGDKPHPRLFQTFPRILRKYVRELRIFSLEEAIHKMTSLAAETFSLDNMGALLPGNYADIVIFDENIITDMGTFKKPDSPPKGINYVLVNGMVVIKNGKHTGKFPGRIIRKK